MLLDAVLEIVFVACETKEPFLRVAAHRLLVNVHCLFSVLLDVPMSDKAEERLATTLVNFLVIGVEVGWQVYLGLVDVQEGHRVALSHGSRFLSVEHVIRWRKDFFEEILSG